jgi:hypothetical protein
MIIRGNVLCVNMQRTDFLEADPTKGSFLVNNPKADLDAAKAAAEAALPKAGGTMKGEIAMDGKKITGLGSPASDGDAAPKSYVDAQRAAAVSVTLTAAAWSSKKQTVNVAGVTANNNVLVTAAPASYVAWSEAVVYCSAQGDGTLTFACDEVPAVDLTANILIVK